MIISLQEEEEEYSSKWAGSLITCLRQHSVAKQSILVPS